jgi:LIM domain/FG-GAP-like repeat
MRFPLGRLAFFFAAVAAAVVPSTGSTTGATGVAVGTVLAVFTHWDRDVSFNSSNADQPVGKLVAAATDPNSPVLLDSLGVDVSSESLGGIPLGSKFETVGVRTYDARRKRVYTVLTSPPAAAVPTLTLAEFDAKSPGGRPLREAVLPGLDPVVSLGVNEQSGEVYGIRSSDFSLFLMRFQFVGNAASGTWQQIFLSQLGSSLIPQVGVASFAGNGVWGGGVYTFPAFDDGSNATAIVECSTTAAFCTSSPLSAPWVIHGMASDQSGVMVAMATDLSSPSPKIPKIMILQPTVHVVASVDAVAMSNGTVQPNLFSGSRASERSLWAFTLTDFAAQPMNMSTTTGTAGTTVGVPAPIDFETTSILVTVGSLNKSTPGFPDLYVVSRKIVVDSAFAKQVDITPSHVEFTTLFSTVARDDTILGAPTRFHAIASNMGGFVGTLDDGVQMSVVGDIDGDGTRDLAVGSLYDPGNQWLASVWILFLHRNGTVRAQQRISSGVGGFPSVLDRHDFFGTGVSGIGDLNNDGVPDLIVGAQNDDDAGYNHGCVYILFLARDGTVAAYSKISEVEGGFTGTLSNSAFFGGATAGVGDVNSDGIPDVLVTSWTHGVWILHLNRDGTVKSDVHLAPSPYSAFGYGADVDGDGRSDFSVQDLGFDGGRGAVFVVRSSTGYNLTASSRIASGEGGFPNILDPGDEFGRASFLDDIDGDAVPDMLVSAYQDDDGAVNRGAIYLLTLFRNGTVKTHEKISDAAGSFSSVFSSVEGIGRSVSTIGDLNGDGVVDLACGSGSAAWIVFRGSNGTAGTTGIIGATTTTTTHITGTTGATGVTTTTIAPITAVSDGTPSGALGAGGVAAIVLGVMLCFFCVVIVAAVAKGKSSQSSTSSASDEESSSSSSVTPESSSTSSSKEESGAVSSSASDRKSSSRFSAAPESSSDFTSDGNEGQAAAIPQVAQVLCKTCSKSVSGKRVEVNGRVWHPDCFRCANCDAVLKREKGGAKMRHGEFWCSKCVADQSVSRGPGVTN